MAMQSSGVRTHIATGRARSIGVGLLAVVGCGVGATLLFWHGDTLQLHPLGGNFVWPVIIGAGVMAMTRGQAPGRSIAALITGSAIGVIVAYEGLNYLPVTPFGTGLAVGIGASLVTLASILTKGRIPFGPAVIAFGLGVGAAQIVPAGPTTTPTDVLAIWTAVAFALGIGVAGSLVVEAILPRTPEEDSPRKARTIDVRDRTIDVTDVEHDGSEPASTAADQQQGGRQI